MNHKEAITSVLSELGVNFTHRRTSNKKYKFYICLNQIGSNSFDQELELYFDENGQIIYLDEQSLDGKDD